MLKPGNVTNADGTPKWRMAPSPHGPYWKDGMQNGYQDVGSWTFFEVDAAEPARGRVALCAVRDVEERVAEEVDCRPYVHPRFRHS